MGIFLVIMFCIFMISASGKARLFSPKEREEILKTNERKREEALKNGGWFTRLTYSEKLATFNKVFGIILLVFLVLTIIF